MPKGFKHSEKLKRKMSIARKGKKDSKETRLKKSIAFKNWLKTHTHQWLGKHHSEESKEKSRNSQIGVKGNNWKGGRFYHRGYVYVKCYNHPYSWKNDYVAEHRLVMEKHIGRYLKPEEIPHHINEVKDDNRIENLLLCANNAEHKKQHKKNRGDNMVEKENEAEKEPAEEEATEIEKE